MSDQRINSRLQPLLGTQTRQWIPGSFLVTQGFSIHHWVSGFLIISQGIAPRTRPATTSATVAPVDRTGVDRHSLDHYPTSVIFSDVMSSQNSIQLSNVSSWSPLYSSCARGGIAMISA